MRLRHRLMLLAALAALCGALAAGAGAWAYGERREARLLAAVAGAELARLLAEPGAATRVIREAPPALHDGTQDIPLPLAREGGDWPAQVIVHGAALPEPVLQALHALSRPQEYFSEISLALALIRRDASLEVDGRVFVAPSLWRARPDPRALAVGLGAGALALAALLAGASLWLARPVEALAGPVDGPLPPGDEARRIARRIEEVRAEVDERDRQQLQLVAAMSHDLHTPFTRLRLKAEFLSAPERDSMLGDLDEIDTMLTETLRLLRGEDAREPAVMVDMTSMVETVCDELQDMGQPVTWHPPPPRAVRDVESLTAGATVEPGPVRRVSLHGRPVALRRAVVNLIQNAIKYGGSADVFLTESHKAVRVEVIDRGPGIAVQDWERVKQPFVRLEKSRDRRAGGSGLGLAVVASVAEAHGGTLTFHRVRHGFMVRLSLPREAG
ncbi:sensor histidine kinase [Halovulum sp. GXIMD14794]